MSCTALAGTTGYIKTLTGTTAESVALDGSLCAADFTGGTDTYYIVFGTDVTFTSDGTNLVIHDG